MKTVSSLATVVIFFALLAGCGNATTHNSRSVPQDNIWQFYRLSLQEGDEKARFLPSFAMADRKAMRSNSAHRLM